jgi:ribosomal protein S18 acetylase RimI-like enzyme
MMDDMVTFRSARVEDLTAIVAMLADDALGAARERFDDPLPAVYSRAFEAINRDPNQDLIVAERDGSVAGVLQLTFIASLTWQGSTRALIEGVRVASDLRGMRIGEALVREAIERARRHGCAIVQLTTDRSRADAHRFYERLGFKATHVGMKLHLDARPAGADERGVDAPAEG